MTQAELRIATGNELKAMIGATTARPKSEPETAGFFTDAESNCLYCLVKFIFFSLYWYLFLTILSFFSSECKEVFSFNPVTEIGDI
jgi:hypothetical protein